mmetsp:Transcript_14721/g.19402  ORF Transcript_14721/g.19402 Transcript_14721/m.19402 type:complete len:82 (-) Transcript_14721:1599-1844(-)
MAFIPLNCFPMDMVGYHLVVKYGLLSMAPEFYMALIVTFAAPEYELYFCKYLAEPQVNFPTRIFTLNPPLHRFCAAQGGAN